MNSWTYEVTLYGYCWRLRTNMTKIDHRTAIARRSALTVYLGFNKTDGSHGWNNQLSGYTVFFNWMEGTVLQVQVQLGPGIRPL